MTKAIKAAFEKAGVPEWQVQIDAAISLALNHGASAEDIRAYVAQRLSGEGQAACADDGRLAAAQPRHNDGDAAAQRDGGEGHRKTAEEGHAAGAPSSSRPDRGGAGHTSSAENGQSTNARPVREPSKAQIAAAGRVAKKLATLDTFTIRSRHGGRIPMGDLHVASLGQVMKRLRKLAWVSSREYNLLYLLKSEADKHAHIPQHAQVRDIIDDDLAKKLIRMATDLALPAGEDGEVDANAA